MAGVCNVDNESVKPIEPSSESDRKRIIHPFTSFPQTLAASPSLDRERNKRQRFDTPASLPTNNDSNSSKELSGFVPTALEVAPKLHKQMMFGMNSASGIKFAMTSACGRRPDMEDAGSIHLSFFQGIYENQKPLNFYGVFDGHGCSHVAMKCRDRMHDIVKDELNMDGNQRLWPEIMTASFCRMDEEITEWSNTADITSTPCQCELRQPLCNYAGSTAVVAIVSPEKIIVSNCGDSRAVLCRNGNAIPLSVDQKPDRPDELARILAAGGYVTYQKGPRVCNILAMSRAIGDTSLKPYVIPEPEVTITRRSSDDECLIIASDGLWDVVSNQNACDVVQSCFEAHTKTLSPSQSQGNVETIIGNYSACSAASTSLTKLALTNLSVDNITVVVVDLR